MAKSFSFKGVGQTQAKKIESDPNEIRRTISQVLSSQSPAVIWIKDRSYVVKSKLSDKTHPLKNIIIEQVEGMDPQELVKVLEQQGSKECYLTLYSKSSSVIGVPTHFIEVTDDGYVFELPEKIVKIDRRKEPRLKIPRGYRVEVSFELEEDIGTNIQKLVYDISVSGLSFVIEKQEAELYSTGLKIRQFSFRLRSKLMICQAIVRNQVPVIVDGEAKEYKIGVSFIDLSEEDQETIHNYLIENMIQYMQS